MDFTNETQKLIESTLKPVEPIPLGKKGSRISIPKDGVMYVDDGQGLLQSLEVKAGDVVEFDGSKWFVVR